MPTVTTAFYCDFRQDDETKQSFVPDKKEQFFLTGLLHLIMYKHIYSLC